jgi:hypothetical protein
LFNRYGGKSSGVLREVPDGIHLLIDSESIGAAYLPDIAAMPSL